MRSSPESLSLPSYTGANLDRKRLLGAFYTPQNLAQVLAKWALSPSVGTVLDPSFGGCVFLEAAASILSDHGVRRPGRLIFGVDVDSSCAEYYRAIGGLIEENCVIRDFLELSPVDVTGAPFQAVIGNPPFIRRHWLTGTTLAAAKASVEDSGVPLPGTASSWAYFIIHAMKFLASDGRLAMLVPEAILQTNYSKVVRETLAARFSSVCLIYLRNRVFDCTSEPVVVVAASGYGESGALRIESVESIDALDEVLNKSMGIISSPGVTTTSGRIVDSAAVDILNELEQQNVVQKFSDLATVEIGLVTGSNNHFIRSRQDLEQLQVPSEAWKPVVPRARWLAGIEFTKENLQEFINKGHRSMLVMPEPGREQDPGIKEWIDEGIKSGVHNRVKCRVRTPWFRVKLPPVPDAFATCSRLGSPLLVLNRADCWCSNALHAVRWRSDADVAPEVAAVGFLTSAVSVWAEIHGRRYGGGVLKMEPSTLKRAPLPIVGDAGNVFDEINELLRRGRENEARHRADDQVLRKGLGLKKNDIKRLQNALAVLISQRRPVRVADAHG